MRLGERLRHCELTGREQAVVEREAMWPFKRSAERELVDSLEVLMQGNGWSLEPYWLSHLSGVRVWIANKDYGISVHGGDGSSGGMNILKRRNRTRLWESSQRCAGRYVLSKALAPTPTQRS